MAASVQSALRKSQLAAKNAQIEELTAEIEALRQENVMLNDQIASVEGDQSLKMRELEVELDDKRKELNLLRSKVNRLENNSLANASSDQSATMREAEIKLRDAKNHIVELTSEVAGLRKKTRNLEGQIAVLEQKASQTEDQKREEVSALVMKDYINRKRNEKNKSRLELENQQLQRKINVETIEVRRLTEKLKFVEEQRLKEHHKSVELQEEINNMKAEHSQALLMANNKCSMLQRQFETERDKKRPEVNNTLLLLHEKANHWLAKYKKEKVMNETISAQLSQLEAEHKSQTLLLREVREELSRYRLITTISPTPLSPLKLAGNNTSNNSSPAVSPIPLAHNDSLNRSLDRNASGANMSGGSGANLPSLSRSAGSRASGNNSRTSPGGLQKQLASPAPNAAAQIMAKKSRSPSPFKPSPLVRSMSVVPPVKRSDSVVAMKNESGRGLIKRAGSDRDLAHEHTPPPSQVQYENDESLQRKRLIVGELMFMQTRIQEIEHELELLRNDNQYWRALHKESEQERLALQRRLQSIVVDDASTSSDEE